MDKRYSTPAGTPASTMDEGLRAYLLKTYNLVFSAVAITFGVAYAGVWLGIAESITNVMAYMGFYALIPMILLVFGLPVLVNRAVGTQKPRTAALYLFGFSALFGLLLSTIVMVTPVENIVLAGTITASIFAAASLYGYTTKKSLHGMGSFLFMGLIGLIVAMLLNFVLQSSVLMFAISAAGVLIFTGLTAYDVQRIAAKYDSEPGNRDGNAVIGALDLYLDFINLFLHILRFVGTGGRS